MHVLIIDDMKADHDLTMQYLTEQEEDHQFYHAYNAVEGIKLYRSNPIDCVLLDYRLPDMNGLDTLKQLMNIDKHIPVIMITGDGNEFVAVTAMKLGSQDYISKKILTPSALKRAIDRAVEHAQIVGRIEKYRADLERSNHDLEQFANIVAHDLKSPLRAIAQHLSLVYRKNADKFDEKSKCSLDFAVDGAERMQLLIDALFDYARLGFTEPQFRIVDLSTLLKKTLQDLSTIIEESGAQITYDELPQVKVDTILVSQLLQNLITNAIKYSSETPRIHISASNENHYWRIGIKDNGIGIPADQHEQIFTIFRRLHHADEYPGIGLGLAICDRIVKQHGGVIGVHSEPGKGSFFYFTLPSAQSISEEKEKAYG